MSQSLKISLSVSPSICLRRYPVPPLFRPSPWPVEAIRKADMLRWFTAPFPPPPRWVAKASVDDPAGPGSWSATPPAPRHGSSRGLVWLRSSNRKRPVTLFPICPQHSVSLGGSPSGPPGGAVATAWLRGVGGWGREGRRPDVASLPPLCPAAGCTGLRRASGLVWPGLGRPKAMPRDGGQSRHTSSCTEDSTKRSIELTSIFFLTPRSWLFSWSCQNECLSSFGTSENRLCFSAACFQ